MSLKMKSCPECTNYNTCTRLCATAELFVNQDYVPRNTRMLLYPTIGDFGLDYVFFNKGMSASILMCDLDYSVDLSFLTEREKDCLKLYFFEGRKLREIGDILGINLKTAHEYIRRAKEKCKKHFAVTR